MKSHELRTGNLIYNGGKGIAKKVMKVTGHTISQLEKGFIHNKKPIPLTEEWLEMFGFDKHGKIKSTKFLFRICFDEETPYAYLETYSGGEYKIEIKYVHQLQNLYFALTGEKLTLQNINSENTNKQY